MIQSGLLCDCLSLSWMRICDCGLPASLSAHRSHTNTHIAHRPLHKIAMTMTIRYTATATCHSFFNRSSLSPMPLAASQKVLNSFYILLLHVSSKESLTVMRDCQCQVDPVRIPSNRDRMNSRSRNNSNNNEIK